MKFFFFVFFFKNCSSAAAELIHGLVFTIYLRVQEAISVPILIGKIFRYFAFFTKIFAKLEKIQPSTGLGMTHIAGITICQIKSL